MRTTRLGFAGDGAVAGPAAAAGDRPGDAGTWITAPKGRAGRAGPTALRE
jgi:hypothetical protein